jgi:hypothetical protein
MNGHGADLPWLDLTQLEKPLPDVGIGRYGLRTFRPAIVRDEPYLVSVSQDPIPPANRNQIFKQKWRELLTDSHPISWADGTCTAVCAKWSSSPGYKPNSGWKHGDVIPDENCNCGIYALDDLANLNRQYGQYTKIVATVISASGRTFEYNEGVKTQFARVVAYWVLDHEPGCVCELCGHRRTQSVLTPPDVNFRVPAEDFPYLACCERQFVGAERFKEPDEMALHFGLKATPLPQRIQVTQRQRRPGLVDLSPLATLVNHAPGTTGHYQFEFDY